MSNAVEVPYPAGFLAYDAQAPDPVLCIENGEPIWVVLVYGWRDFRGAGEAFGNHVYKYSARQYATPRWVELERQTAGRGQLVSEYNAVYLWSTEETGQTWGGRKVIRQIKEKLVGLMPEDIGGH